MNSTHYPHNSCNYRGMTVQDSTIQADTSLPLGDHKNIHRLYPSSNVLRFLSNDSSKLFQRDSAERWPPRHTTRAHPLRGDHTRQSSQRPNSRNLFCAAPHSRRHLRRSPFSHPSPRSRTCLLRRRRRARLTRQSDSGR